MKKENLKKLVKSLEFAGVLGLTGLGMLFGGVSLFWGALIGGTYIALNVFGLATKNTKDVIDDIKKK